MRRCHALGDNIELGVRAGRVGGAPRYGADVESEDVLLAFKLDSVTV
jgi:hypothetical protein